MHMYMIACCTGDTQGQQHRLGDTAGKGAAAAPAERSPETQLAMCHTDPCLAAVLAPDSAGDLHWAPHSPSACSC